MHVCPDCGKTLTAPPSYCSESDVPLFAEDDRDLSYFAFFVVLGLTVATVFLVGRTLIG